MHVSLGLYEYMSLSVLVCHHTADLGISACAWMLKVEAKHHKLMGLLLCLARLIYSCGCAHLAGLSSDNP